MKKLNIIAALLITILVSLSFFSCKDKFSEEDALKLQDQLTKNQKLVDDSIAIRKVRVMYTANLIDASKSALKSAKSIEAISGAVIKLTQNGKEVSKTVDSTGIAVFDSLKTGIATVNITLAGYSEVNYTLNFSNYVQSGINGGIQLSNIVPMIPISGTSTATITGKVYCESDLSNRLPETVPLGTTVMAFVSTSSAALPSTNTLVTSISYDNLSMQTTTDLDGNYSLTVPATLSGLDYTIRISDFSENQTVLMTTYNGRDTFGVFSIPAFFGSTYTTAAASTIPIGTSPVIITIGAPDYSFTAASAVAVTENPAGIDYANLITSGSYYGRGSDEVLIDTIRLPLNTPAGSLAPISISVNKYGQVYATKITTHGSDYVSTADNSIYTMPYIIKPASAVVDAVDGSGAITQWHVISGMTGQFFSVDNLEFVKKTGGSSGTGAVLDFPTVGLSSGYLYFSTANQFPTTGINYAVGDTFVLAIKSGMDGNQMTCRLHMQTGIVTAINVTDGGSDYISGKVKIVIDPPSDAAGTTALATATVTNTSISSIDITNNGSGYSSVPTVTIVNQFQKIRAKATATVTSGVVTAINLTAGTGTGYLHVPTVTINPTVPGLGSGATAYASVSNGQVSLTLGNGGMNYIGANYPTTPAGYSTTTVTVKGTSTNIININLGTGKRTVEQ